MSILGNRVIRTEDPRFLTGDSTYVADLKYPGTVHAVFVRSLMASAAPLNPLGAKGIGESGAIGSTPAVQNAVIDAVAHLGIRHIDMPLTAQRVWRSIDAAKVSS
jgi:carbon-monoxide dehydrogenase large subunit